ncbi:MAG: type VII secretion-associated serine protease, partial [Mycolicibacterium sp.]
MRTLRLLTVSALVLAPVSAPGIAAAVTPPPVDETALPAARPPAPRVPTTRHDDCVAAAAGTSADTEPGQLRGLDLRAVWALTRAAGQTVAVIDTGVARHRRLPHLVPGGDYVWTQDGTADCDGHGTLV